MNLAGEPSEIQFPRVNLSAIANPIPAIMSAPEFERTIEFLKSTPASKYSLLGPAPQALIFSLIRNARPEHVVEIGSFKGGTTQAMSRAIDANGVGLVHTIGPFDSERFLPNFETWPEPLKSRVRFHPVDSMSFFMQLQHEGIKPWLVFIDGCHDYEFALFDIQCAARSLAAGGFIVIDNINQGGPYFAAVDFMAANPTWLNCERMPAAFNPTLAFDKKRRVIAGVPMIVLRSPSFYVISDRPRTFGEEIWPAPTVRGVKLQLGESNKGILHVQCVLRGFLETSGVQLACEMSQTVDGEQSELQLVFNEPLTAEGDLTRRRTVETWFSWTGLKPLMLRDFPITI